VRRLSKLAGDPIKSEIVHLGVIDMPPWQRAGFFTYGDYWLNRKLNGAVDITVKFYNSLSVVRG